MIEYLTGDANMGIQNKRHGGSPSDKLLRVDYLEARRLITTLRRASMPTNKDLDTALNEFGQWKMPRTPTPYVSDSVLVVLGKGNVFEASRDFVDCHTDLSGRNWIIPASDIPKEALNLPNVGIMLNHPEIDDGRNAVAVVPGRETFVFFNFIRQTGQYGIMDLESALPVRAIPSPEFGNDDVRRLFRTQNNGIRPIYRLSQGLDFYRIVGADLNQGASMSVSFVSAQDGLLHAVYE